MDYIRKKMLKLIIVFIAGTVETFLFTWWNLAANKKKAIRSSVLMMIYMFLYLTIISVAIKDTKDTYLLMATYALSCGLGNFIKIKTEKNEKTK